MIVRAESRGDSKKPRQTGFPGLEISVSHPPPIDTHKNKKRHDYTMMCPPTCYHVCSARGSMLAVTQREKKTIGVIPAME